MTYIKKHRKTIVLLLIALAVIVTVWLYWANKQAEERERQAEAVRRQEVVTVAKGTFDVSIREIDRLIKIKRSVLLTDVLKKNNGLTLSAGLQDGFRADNTNDLESALIGCRSILSDELIDQGFSYRNIKKRSDRLYAVAVEWDGIQEKNASSKEKNPSRLIAEVDITTGKVVGMKCELTDSDLTDAAKRSAELKSLDERRQ